MSWTCPNCQVTCGSHGRKCTTYNCRTHRPGGGGGGGAASSLAGAVADGGSSGEWQCLACSYAKNYAGRRACYRCGTAKQIPGQPQQRAMPPRRSPVQSKAQPMRSVQSEVSSAPKGRQGTQLSFAQMVRQEAAKAKGEPAPTSSPISPGGSDSSATAQLVQDEEKAQEEIRSSIGVISALVAAMEALPGADAGVTALLESRRAEREDLRTRLRTLKPLATRLRIVTE